MVHFYGRDALNQTAMVTFYDIFNKILSSTFGNNTVEIRWTNYTAHPSQTPGAPYLYYVLLSCHYSMLWCF